LPSSSYIFYDFLLFFFNYRRFYIFFLHILNCGDAAATRQGKIIQRDERRRPTFKKQEKENK
jgi:hypothetical protein